MVDIRDAKIRKKEFHFDVRKRYQHVEHYRLRKKSPGELVKEKLKAVFAPKPKEKPKKKKVLATSAPPPSGFNFKILGAMILVAILLLGLGWLYISSAFLQFRPGTFEPALETPTMENWITGGNVITAGERSSEMHSAIIITELSSSNIESYELNLTTYSEVVPTEVFVLNAPMVEATTYPTFLRELRSILSKRGILLNEITLEQLETIPGGAIVIVPTGVIPQQLLGIDSSANFNDLVKRGVVFVYMGQPFTKMHDGQFTVNTPEDLVDDLPLTFSQRTLVSSDGFHLYQPLYQVSSAGGYSSFLLYGSVSVLKQGNGAIIFIPATLDGGWRDDAALAAQDVSLFVFDTPWLTPNSDLKHYEFNVSGDNEESLVFFTNPFDETECSIKAEFVGHTSASKTPLIETMIYRVEKDTLGELFVDGGYTAVPTNITNTRIRMNAELKEPEPAQPNMYLIIVDMEGNEEQRIPQGNLNVQSDVNLDIPLYVDQGEYVVGLVDDGGRTYAETYLNVVSIEITRVFAKGLSSSQYAFDVTMGDEPVTLEEVTVVVDGGSLGTYESTDVSRIIVDLSQYTGGDELPLGNHSFEFAAGGLKKTLYIERVIPPNPLTDPTFLIVAFLALGIAGVGMYFARQETVYFSLDIPDFPPVARTKVPLTSDVVLSVFQKVNDGYRWKNAPLTISEIRNGFKNIFYRGKPIYITDYNVEYLLDEMIKIKKVGHFLDYYCPLSWEQKVKRSVRYMSMMRKLRDICVNNAVPFTGLNKSKVADSEINVVGQDMYVHFYDSQSSMDDLFSNVLSTVGKGISIVLFRNEAEKHDFRMLLNSSCDAPLVVKMENEGGTVLLRTIPEFTKMLVELKSF